MKKLNKRILSALLALLLFLNSCPVPAFSADIEDETVPETTQATEATEPVVTDPPATEPQETESQVTEPEVTEPEETEPEETEPEETEPEETEPEETEPEETEPEETEPEETEPEETEPEETEPEETEPEETEPEETEPEETEPADNCPYCEDTADENGETVHAGDCNTNYVYDGTEDVGKYAKLTDSAAIHGVDVSADPKAADAAKHFDHTSFVENTILFITDWYWDLATSGLWYRADVYSGGVIAQVQEEWPSPMWILKEYTNPNIDYGVILSIFTPCSICEEPGCETEHKKCDVCGVYDCATAHSFCKLCMKYDCGIVHNTIAPVIMMAFAGPRQTDPMVGKLVTFNQNTVSLWSDPADDTTKAEGIPEDFPAQMRIVDSCTTEAGDTFYKLESANETPWPALYNDFTWTGSSFLTEVQEEPAEPEVCEVCGKDFAECTIWCTVDEAGAQDILTLGYLNKAAETITFYNDFGESYPVAAASCPDYLILNSAFPSRETGAHALYSADTFDDAFFESVLGTYMFVSADAFAATVGFNSQYATVGGAGEAILYENPADDAAAQYPVAVEEIAGEYVVADFSYDFEDAANWYFRLTPHSRWPQEAAGCLWINSGFITGLSPTATQPEEPKCDCNCETCTGDEECQCGCGECAFCVKLVEGSVQDSVGGQTVTVSGMLPEGASLQVVPIASQAAVMAELGIEGGYLWDIKIFDADGNEWQPAEGETVSVSLPVSSAPDGSLVDITHILDSVDAIEAGVAAGNVIVEAVGRLGTFFSREITACQEATGSADSIALEYLSSLTVHSGYVNVNVGSFSIYFWNGSDFQHSEAGSSRGLVFNPSSEVRVYYVESFADTETVVHCDIGSGDGWYRQWQLSKDDGHDDSYETSINNTCITGASGRLTTWTVGDNTIDFSFSKHENIYAHENGNVVWVKGVRCSVGGTERTSARIKFILFSKRDLTYHDGGVSCDLPEDTHWDSTYWGDYESRYVGADHRFAPASLTIGAPTNIQPGYRFLHWENTDTNTSQKILYAGDTYETSLMGGGLTLVAQWERISYNITYNLNGGSVSKANKASYDVETDSFTLNNPTRPGYTFAGWTGTGLSGKTMTVTIPKGSTGNRTYTANWTANPHTATFEANGGSVSPATKSYNADTALVLPTPTRSGHYFNGWKVTTPAGNWTNGATFTGTVTKGKYGDVTFTAQWIPIYKVTLDAQNGSGDSDGTTAYWYLHNTTKEVDGEVVYYWTNQDCTTPLSGCTITKPEKRGYTFGGYYTEKEGKGTQYVNASGVCVTNLYAVANPANITLYAYWIPTTYKVSYNANNGKGTMEDHYATYDSSFKIKDNAFTPPTGKKFAGWTTYSNGTNDGYNWSNPSTNLGWSGPWVYVNGEYGIANNQLNLYARWTNKQFTITYDANGGDGTMDSQTVTFGDYIKIQDNGFEAPVGKQFAGWGISPDGPAHQGGWSNADDKTGWGGNWNWDNGSYGIANDRLVLYAIWEDLTYTVTWKNGETVLQTDIVSYNGSSTCTIIPPTTESGGYRYTFSGWDKGTDGTVSGITANTEVNAQFTQTLISYTVTFDSNGGTGAASGRTYNIESELALPTPTKTGYEVSHWIVTVASDTWKVGDKYSGTIAAGNYGNVTLQAQWTPVTYTISYTLGGGTVATANKTGYTIETGTFTLNNPTRDGYEFVGWTGSNGTTPQKTVSITQGSTGDKSYTANWTGLPYTVTFKHCPTSSTDVLCETTKQLPLGTVISDFTPYLEEIPGYTHSPANTPSYTVIASNNQSAAVYYKENTVNISYVAVPAAGGTLTKTSEEVGVVTGNPSSTASPAEGYELVGWYADAACTNKLMEDATFSLTLDEGELHVAATYYAKFEPADFDVTWVFGNGKEDQTVPVTFGTPITAPTNPERDHYTFSGWSPEIPATMPALAQTFTAQWTAIPYSISYDLDGGTATGSNPVSYTIETESFTLSNPTKEHYEFAGWTGTGLTEATQEVTIETGSTGTREYTATWSPDSYTYDVIYQSKSNKSLGSTTLTKTYGTTETVVPPEIKGYETPEAQDVVWDSDSKTITFVYNPITYTIDFETNDGPEQWTYTIESNRHSIPNPSRSGYTFAGWVGTGLEKPTFIVVIEQGSTGNRAYTATWSPVPYPITYDLKGGSFTSAYPQSYTIESNEITLPQPTRTGYHFTGWTGSNGTEPQTSVTIPAGSTGERTYTANWSAKQYWIEFDFNGGQNGTTSAGGTSKYPVSYDDYGYGTLTMLNPNKLGHVFEGWYTDLTGGDMVYNEEHIYCYDGATPYVNSEGQWIYDGNETFYAHWKLGSYTIRFDGNGGTTENPLEDRTVYFNESITLPANPYSRNVTVTYQLNYESTEANPGPVIVSAEFRGWTAPGSLENAQPGTVHKNLTLNMGSVVMCYAQWKFNPITNPVVQRDGYTFTGWWHDANQNDQLDEGELYTVDQEFTPTENATLVAQWERSEFDVTFDTDGGTLPDGTVNPASCYVGTDVTLPTPTKAGYLFKGWQYDADDSGAINGTEGDTLYNQDVPFEMPNKNVTLVARWLDKRLEKPVKVGINMSFYVDNDNWTYTYPDQDYPSRNVGFKSVRAYKNTAGEWFIQTTAEWHQGQNGGGWWDYYTNALPGDALNHIKESTLDPSNGFTSNETHLNPGYTTDDIVYGIVNTNTGLKAYLNFTEAEYTSIITKWLNTDTDFFLNKLYPNSKFSVDWELLRSTTTAADYTVVPYVIKFQEKEQTWFIDMAIHPKIRNRIVYDVNLADGYTATAPVDTNEYGAGFKVKLATMSDVALTGNLANKARFAGWCYDANENGVIDNGEDATVYTAGSMFTMPKFDTSTTTKMIAKWDYPESLKISASGNANETFFFQVTGTNENVNMTVSVRGGGYVIIDGLYCDSYTVTELNSWSWTRESVAAETKELLATDNVSVNEVAFTLPASSTCWLHNEGHN